MSGHFLSRLRCALRGDHDWLWRVGPRGIYWECTRCLHSRPSPVLKPLRPATGSAEIVRRA